MTYRRLPDSEVKSGLSQRQRETARGSNANDLNSFRKRVSTFFHITTFGHAHDCHQYFEGFKHSAASGDRKEIPAIELKVPLGSDQNTSSYAFLAKRKEMEELKNRAMKKDQELRALESTLAQKNDERKAEIESLKKDLGHERQAWMTTGNE